ncbi:MAG: transporter permease subunit-2 [Haloplasmataceae bacterium]|jgi:spermidine/putrescine transport system permease protein|nr:transporter permease subunit-2 [Haloplasmataceae bacterium]
MVKSKNILSKIYLALIIIFLYVPVLIIVMLSFNKGKMSSVWKGFTFKWYEEIFYNDELIKAFLVSLSIALITTFVSTILGTLSVIGIHNLKQRHRSYALTVNQLPILNPDIVTGISLMILFLAVKVQLGFTTMLLAHIIFSTPYVILSILPKLKQLNPSLLEAALDLGATPGVALRKVLLPQLAPGIVTGALIAFTLSIDDFVISYFTTGQGVKNLSTWIFSQTKRGITPTAYAISTIMLIIVISLLIIIFIRLAKDLKKKETA